MLENPTSAMFFDQLRASVYEKEINDVIVPEFRRVMGLFMQTAIEKGEIDPMPLEVYWSVAFAPLYNLIRFHQRGKSVAGRAFKLTDEVLWKTFDLVLKALLK